MSDGKGYKPKPEDQERPPKPPPLPPAAPFPRGCFAQVNAGATVSIEKYRELCGKFYEMEKRALVAERKAKETGDDVVELLADNVRRGNIMLEQQARAEKAEAAEKTLLPVVGAASIVVDLHHKLNHPKTIAGHKDNIAAMVKAINRLCGRVVEYRKGRE